MNQANFPTAWNKSVAKPCDHCHSAPALLFCRSDSAFTCIPCDAKHHASMKHERVSMCDACEQSPAAVTCKADAASLCFACDRDIHSANALARRHDRVPVVPFSNTAAESGLLKSTGPAPLPPSINEVKLEDCVSNNGYVCDPWNISKLPEDVKSDPWISKLLPEDLLFFSEPDPFIDFDSYMVPPQSYNDNIVPVQSHEFDNNMVPPQSYNDNIVPVQSHEFDSNFTSSNMNSYNTSYTTSSISQSGSSMDVGVVPDTLFDISYTLSNLRDDVIISNQGNAKAVGMDREARVLRYKEKRKNRKFQKTIRYASRKAYAETRPRIKGRFVKRTDSEFDFPGIFESEELSFFADGGYGVVPSFQLN